MRAPALRLLVASLLIVTTPLPAIAQFGFPGVRIPGMGRSPLPLPVPGIGRGGGFFPGMPFGRMHRTFGILGAVVVGSFILGRLSRRDGVEVTRRTKVVLDRDRDKEVVDTYQTKDGGNRVTITAAPVQRVTDLHGDPVLKQTAETAKHATEEARSEKRGAKTTQDTTKLESEFLKVDALPPETECRKVTTEIEFKTVAKRTASRKEKQATTQGPEAATESEEGGKKQAADNKSTNTSILCQTTAGEWKPASA